MDVTSDARRAVNGSLTRDLKFEFVRALDARGVFLARGSVRQVASALEIATPTIYKYIQQGPPPSGNDQENRWARKEAKGFRSKANA